VGDLDLDLVSTVDNLHLQILQLCRDVRSAAPRALMLPQTKTKKISIFDIDIEVKVEDEISPRCPTDY